MGEVTQRQAPPEGCVQQTQLVPQLPSPDAPKQTCTTLLTGEDSRSLASNPMLRTPRLPYLISRTLLGVRTPMGHQIAKGISGLGRP